MDVQRNMEQALDRTFMRSYPNFIPLSAQEIESVEAVLRPFAFDRIYGWSPQRTLDVDAKRAVERSVERQIRAMQGSHGVVAN